MLEEARLVAGLFQFLSLYLVASHRASTGEGERRPKANPYGITVSQPHRSAGWAGKSKTPDFAVLKYTVVVIPPGRGVGLCSGTNRGDLRRNRPGTYLTLRDGPPGFCFSSSRFLLCAYGGVFSATGCECVIPPTREKAADGRGTRPLIVIANGLQRFGHFAQD